MIDHFMSYITYDLQLKYSKVLAPNIHICTGNSFTHSFRTLERPTFRRPLLSLKAVYGHFISVDTLQLGIYCLQSLTL